MTYIIRKGLFIIDKILSNFFIGIALTAIIGGFLLGFINKKSVDETNDYEDDSLPIPVHDYTTNTNAINEVESLDNDILESVSDLAENNKGTNDNEINNDEETNLENENNDLEIEQHEHEYEESKDIFDIYEGVYPVELIEKSIKITHKASSLLFNIDGHIEEWAEFSTERFIDSLLSRNKSDFIYDIDLFGVSIVPIESDYEGIAIGGYCETIEGVALFEFDYKVYDDEVLLDDIKFLWGS